MAAQGELRRHPSRRPRKCIELLRHKDGFYPGFVKQAAKKPKYRIGGIEAGMSAVGANNAREVWLHYSLARVSLLGRQIVREKSDWSKEFSFRWEDELNYPTFLKAYDGEPILFHKSVQILGAF